MSYEATAPTFTEAELYAISSSEAFVTVLGYSTKAELETLLAHGVTVANDQAGVEHTRNIWRDLNRLIRKQIKKY